MVSPKYEWVLRADAAETFATQDDLLTFLLRLRGVEPERHQAFLTPLYEDALHDSSLLPDFSAAIERVLSAREGREAVAIFGDYDVDGVTASAILFQAFRAAGISARVLLPHREQDGYGLTVAAVRELVPPATLLVTIDNGMNAHEPIAEAQKRGADVIVIDHHTVQGPLPEGALVVNPARSGHAYPFPRLCAAGLAFKFARELLLRVGQEGTEKWFLDLVALGTLADRVPLIDENRCLARLGVRVLREQSRLGLSALAARARVSLASCDAHTVSFRLIPRLNAAGRMRHADLAFRLLTTENPREAEELAEVLEQVNDERKKLTDSVVTLIQERLVRSVPLPDMLCVSGPWPAGILGILAGRVAEEIGRPAVVIGVGPDRCVASVRGNGTVNVVDVLGDIASSLTKFGGHAEAAGFSFPRAQLEEVESFFSTVKLPSAARAIAALSIDCALPPAMVTRDMARQLESLEPHGEGNERPVFRLDNLRVDDVRSLGVGGEHQRFSLSSLDVPNEAFSAVAFRWGRRALPERGERLDVAAEVRLDRFRNRGRVDLHVRDIQTHQVSKKKVSVSTASPARRARR